MIKLYEYQQPFYDEIMKKVLVDKIKKVCGVLPTGGGKSVVLGKIANNLPGRTLILTHRQEIMFQNSEWVENVGLLSSKVNTLKYDNKVIIAMVQTLDARIKKYGIEYLGKIDNILLDEIHILIFEKVFKQYDYNCLIGLTGTPVLNKKKYSSIDGVEYVEDFTLSEIFDDIVIGPDSQDLIDENKLCQDYNIVLKLPDFDKLKESDASPDGYTKKSLNELYANTASLNILDEAYEKYCKNKKTLIFNASTKINKFVYNNFKQKGLNVKMFDSVSQAEINPETNKKFTRKEIIKWFEDEKDAILINTNVFTTGFNVTDVECVIINRATKSLSLWIQMVGRGSRTTNKIFKDKFTVIDLGQNIYQHGIWSKRRNWKSYFYSQGKRLKNKIDMLSTWDCHVCESINIKGEIICSFCGAEKIEVVVDGKTKKTKDGEFEAITDMPIPKGTNIIKYCISNDMDQNMAFSLAREKIIELFFYYKVTKDFYYNEKDRFKKRVRQIFLPIYFAIIKNKEIIQSKVNRTIENELKRIYTKIEKLYK
jgi:superfamily II DNA or RNA helicase